MSNKAQTLVSADQAQHQALTTQSTGILRNGRSFTSTPLQRTVSQIQNGGEGVSRRDATPFSSSSLIGQKRSSEELEQCGSDSDVSVRSARYQKHQDAHVALFDNVTIVYDRRHTAVKNTRLRSTSEISSLPMSVNRTGLLDLKLSGSAAITFSLLKEIREMVGENQQVLIIDLRREPHAVANDHSITWTIPNNWLNIDRPLHLAVRDEKERIHQVRSKNPPQLVAVLHKDYKKELNRPEKKNLIKPKVYSEQEAVESQGMIYARLGVSDHLRPKDLEVDHFLDVVRQMPKDTWVHMHCKGGQGRTTTFMVLYDILRNSGRVSLLDIIKRQKHLGFDYDVSSEGLKDERKQFRRDRWAFIQEFYDFAKTSPLKSFQSWSAWKSSNAVQP